MLPALIAAGAALGSAALGASSARKANKDNQYNMQHQIRWRVEDAKAAGIHPLAALGANIQPVASQPVFGDAALGGIQKAGEELGKGLDNLSRREIESRIRNNDAQTALTLAQSRTIAAAARQPMGATRGDTPPVLLHHGSPIQRDERRFAPADKVQADFGDAAENIHGVPAYFDAILNQMGWETDSYRARRMIREFRRYRLLGGRDPADVWMRRHGFRNQLDRPYSGDWSSGGR